VKEAEAVAKKKKQQKPWQYTFSFGLSLVMLFLVAGYFIQSFIEIRKVKPVSLAIERISERTGVSRGISFDKVKPVEQLVEPAE
jgi:hypothetical protein